jgi:tripartite-type tricarboxylate transporter receptor subunit TctC
LVVPYGTGGIGDVTARIIADGLAPRLGQRVFIENKPGGGGSIGTTQVVRSPADGYTVVIVTGTQLTVLPYTQKLSYDPLADLAPVSIVVSSGLMMAVNSALPVKTMREFIDYARANPGKLSYAINGLGGTGHLVSAAFAARERVNMVGVPYQAVSRAVTDLVAGEVQVYIGGTSGLIDLVRNGNLRALAVSNEKRIPQLPDVPTMDETIPGFIWPVWQAMFAPRDTPRHIVDRLSGEIAEISRNPEIIKRFANLGLEPAGTTPEEVTATVRREIPLYREAIEAAGIGMK